MHEGDHADIDGVAVRSVPLLMTDPKATAADGQRRAGACGRGGVTAYSDTSTAPPRRSRSCPSPGFPSSGPATIWPPRVAAAAPWLRDGDVVVVTSKVVSKCEGRLVAAPAGSRGAR